MSGIFGKCSTVVLACSLLLIIYVTITVGNRINNNSNNSSDINISIISGDSNYENSSNRVKNKNQFQNETEVKILSEAGNFNRRNSKHNKNGNNKNNNNTRNNGGPKRKNKSGLLDGVSGNVEKSKIKENRKRGGGGGDGNKKRGRKNPEGGNRRGRGGSGPADKTSGPGRGRRQKNNKNALRLLAGVADNVEGGGAFPSLFNIASRATILANATCGEHIREEYCKYAYPQNLWNPVANCGICDARSLDLAKRHPIDAVVRNDDGWWQSPTLQNGRHYEYVTITLDLKQVYQIFIVMLKSGASPRPASWILERSLDNVTYEPWQYFGISDADCRSRYGLPSQTGKYVFPTDDDVICTTQFAKALPAEYGEIHISLLKNRPGLKHQTKPLMDFISARFIRIRFQGMHSTAKTGNSVGWAAIDAGTLEKRSYYALKAIRVTGRLQCHGHANRTIDVVVQNITENSTIEEATTTELQCVCLHNTCGPDCSKCCPLYNQQPYQEGKLGVEFVCEKCQCYGHAKSCEYDENVAQERLSINEKGTYHGGGVCHNCMDFTTGINCEKCLPGYFRPFDAPPESACQRCDCDAIGSGGDCNPDGGQCVCQEGFVGFHCDVCAPGYSGDGCRPCSCDSRGTVEGGECDEDCRCKQNVDGRNCSSCARGYFGLRQANRDGCTQCFCSGVSVTCKSAHIEIGKYESLESWVITDLAHSFIEEPINEMKIGLVFAMPELSEVSDLYWLAPSRFSGNQLRSYASRIEIRLSWVYIRGDTSGKPTFGPNLILIGSNGMRIAFGDDIFHGTSALFEVSLVEEGWYHFVGNVNRSARSEIRKMPVTRPQFLSVLANIERFFVRATFHADQVESILEYAALHTADSTGKEASQVEECDCPPGYAGLSCESCAFGYVRISENSSFTDYDATDIVPLNAVKCQPCDCNGHAATCDLDEGMCGECVHNTFGTKCEHCMVGFYGNPRHGTPNDCQRCACPLQIESNNFSPTCQLKYPTSDANPFYTFDYDSNTSYEKVHAISIDAMEYVCTQCPHGYNGEHCERCDDGFYGNPIEIGSKCLPCPCKGGPCNRVTGQCITCPINTEGWSCERCKSGFWGDPDIGCQPCECVLLGSIAEQCDSETGQCPCKSRYTGRQCEKCDRGFTDIDNDCVPCKCNINGSIDFVCDLDSGQCLCKNGVDGKKCDDCDEGYYNLTIDGCQDEFKFLLERMPPKRFPKNHPQEVTFLIDHEYVWEKYKPVKIPCSYLVRLVR